MTTSTVSIVRYEKPYASVKRAIDLCSGFRDLSSRARVFIKPNLCFWRRGTLFPKWGVLTTSRVVEDVVVLLKEQGVGDITIGEGTVLTERNDTATPAEAFEKLGYNALRRKYGVRVINVHERPFEKVDLGRDVTLNFNADFLQSDFVVNLPVLKTHLQAVVTLGIKNLKGVIDIPSRKKCHSADSVKDLNYMIARLAGTLPSSLTVLDGIYTNERGPSFDGNLRRSNILVASTDVLSADMVGAKVLGYAPRDVPHLAHAARDRGRPVDLSDVETAGEKIEDVASFHAYALPYNEEGTLPEQVHLAGVKGITCRRYDSSICTYCAAVLPSLNQVIIQAWRGRPWQNIEILFGKKMKPTPGKDKTILLGKCMYLANKDHPDIKEMIAVKGCPPGHREIVSALQQAGIEVSPLIFEIIDNFLVFLMRKYANDPDFDESFFRVEG